MEVIAVILYVQLIALPLHVGYFFAVRRERKRLEEARKRMWQYYQLVKRNSNGISRR